jgi:transcriptional regulator with XRE-family HTH domain
MIARRASVTLWEPCGIVKNSSSLAIMANQEGRSARPKRSNDMGPTGERVAANLAEVRNERRMNQAELADRVTELGRPMSAPVVSKTEKLDRRIDVDDLVAFAVALDVSPNRLLLASAADGEPVELATEVTVPARNAWLWAVGESYLKEDLIRATGHREADMTRWARFYRENRPYADPIPTVDEFSPLEAQHREAFGRLRRAVDGLLDQGIEKQHVTEWLRLYLTFQGLFSAAPDGGGD